MADQLHIEGHWPSLVSIRRGWARATARPWNDEVPDAFIRLDRGGVDFLKAVTDRLTELTDAAVYSPALYPSATRVWRRSGYEEVHQLEVMERSTNTSWGVSDATVTEIREVDWPQILSLDRFSFEGFWRMSVDGLKESVAATGRSALLATGAPEVEGFAIVGAQWNVSYLQRIAVHPDVSGRGIGRALVRASLEWGRKQGAPTMVLNVRKENSRARRLYEKEGFASTGTWLRILRYGS